MASKSRVQRAHDRGRREDMRYLSWVERCSGPSHEDDRIGWVYYAGCLPRPWKIHRRIH